MNAEEYAELAEVNAKLAAKYAAAWQAEGGAMYAAKYAAWCAWEVANDR